MRMGGTFGYHKCESEAFNHTCQLKGAAWTGRRGSGYPAPVGFSRALFSHSRTHVARTGPALTQRGLEQIGNRESTEGNTSISQ